MKRILALSALLVVASVGAEAQQPRDRLDNVNGVRFGITLEAAKAALGPNATVQEVLRGKDARKVKALTVKKIALFGVPMDISYDFVAGGRLTSVVAGFIPAVGKDSKACHAAGDRLVDAVIRTFGRPDKSVVDQKGVGEGPIRYVQFNFRDGSGIRGEYGLTNLVSVFCDISLYFWSPQGKDDWAHNPL